MTFGVLLLAAVLIDDLADRVNLPGILLVLAWGLLVDNDLHSTSEPLLPLFRRIGLPSRLWFLFSFLGG